LWKEPHIFVERASARTRLAIVAIAATISASVALAEPIGDPEAGARLYLEGRRADGSLLFSKTQRDVALSGPRAACVTCHRPSGFGVSEGGYFVPPINGPTLFSERRLDRGRFLLDRFERAQPQHYRTRLSLPRMRAAYTAETLGRALRTGVDPSGQALDPIMPRYELSESEVVDLEAFLRGLSTKIDPGVTDQEIHFATIVSKSSSSQDREAMLSVVRAYFDWANKNSGGERSRQGFSPYHQSELIGATRKWRLHVWELEGAPDAWPQQLEQKYREEPVFALVSGLAPMWEPVAEFCDSRKIPAFFPNTDLPGRRKDGATFYFTAGLELEARGLAAYFSGERRDETPILQVVGAGPTASEPARVFDREARAAGVAVDTIVLGDAGNIDSALSGRAPEIIVLWPGEWKDEQIDSLLSASPNSSKVFLPSRILRYAETEVARSFSDRLFFVDPYEVDVQSHPLSFRVRAWMNTRGVTITNPQLQFQTYYALSLLDAAIVRLKTDFFRDFLIESAEHESEGDLNPGVFPHLSLGPGQRVASHGIYVVRAPSGKDSRLEFVKDWIIP
jgi:hypothetical protein